MAQKKLVQTTLEGDDLKRLEKVTAANGSSEAATARLAIKVGLEILEDEITARHQKLISRRKQIA